MEIDITKLYSQQDYADLIGVTRQAINKQVLDKKIKTLKVAGKDMIYLPLLES